MSIEEKLEAIRKRVSEIRNGKEYVVDNELSFRICHPSLRDVEQFSEEAKPEQILSACVFTDDGQHKIWADASQVEISTDLAKSMMEIATELINDKSHETVVGN